MAKLKLDTSQLKQFLLQRGERVGLAVAGLVMFLFLALGVLAALRSSSPDQEILRVSKGLQEKIKEREPDPAAMPKPPTAPTWDPLLDPYEWATEPFFRSGTSTDGKRRNPLVLAVGRMVRDKAGKDQLTDVQVDFKRGAVQIYELNFADKSVRVFTKGGPSGMANPGFGGMFGIRPGDFGATTIQQPGTATGASSQIPVHDIRSERLVIVSASFPWREQLELFRKALRKDTISELFGDPKEQLAPHVLGLYVWRYEIGPDGKSGNLVPIYTATEEGGKPLVSDKAPKTRELMKLAVYDEDNPARLASVVLPGLVTPLPKLAHGDYPPLQIADLTGKEDKESVAQGAAPGIPGMPAGLPGFPGFPGMKPGAVGPAMPGFKGGKGAAKDPKTALMPGIGPGTTMPGADNKTGEEIRTGDVPYTKLPNPMKKQFSARIRNTVAVFNPLGVTGGAGRASGPGGMGFPFPFAPGGDTEKKKDKKDDDDDDDTPAAPGAGADAKKGFPFMMPGGQGQGTDSSSGVPEKVLVRFFDADVVPGKTYQYVMSVRIKNPNYKKPDVVIFKALADIKELAGPWTRTPSITIPGEWDFYAVDQYALSAEAKKSAAKGSDLPNKGKEPNKDRAAVQIHKWVETFQDVNHKDRPLGDWEVLERLVLYRGEPVGDRRQVEIPEWVPEHDRFELTGLTGKVKGKKKGDVGLDFSPPDGSPPVLVDFTGGAKIDYTVVGRPGQVRDDSAVEMLLIGADGKLFLRNGRVDSDPETPRGHARLEHYTRWHERLMELKGSNKQGGPGGPPKGPPAK